MKRGTPSHPKTLDLAIALAVKRWGAVGLLESLWHFTVSYAPSGDIGRHSDAAIARALDWDGEPAVLVRALVAHGWLDRCRCHRLRVHDWPGHADQTCKRALANAGASFLPCYSDASSLLAEAPEADSPPLPLAVAVALPLAKPEPLAGPVVSRPPTGSDCPDSLRAEMIRLSNEGAGRWAGGLRGGDLIAQASMVGDRCIDNPNSIHLSKAWVEATVSKLRQMRAVYQAEHPSKAVKAPNPAEAWIEANGGAEKLARECAESCGWSENAGPRAAWREKRGAPDGVAALLHWPIARAIEAHHGQQASA